MQTRVDEIAAGVYRFSTYVAEADFMFNQFLLDAEEPMLFHAGPRRMFPLVAAAFATVRPVEELRWVAFGHVEADECGAMNEWLAVALHAQVVHSRVGCMVSIDDLADRTPRPLDDGEVLDLGGRRVRHLATPHVPHGWDACLYYDETTGTLLCGDLFTAVGDSKPLVGSELLGPAIAAEDLFAATCLTPSTGRTLRRLGDLAPTTLGLMHGPSYAGDGAEQLRGLADAYDERLAAAGPVLHSPVQRPEAARIN